MTHRKRLAAARWQQRQRDCLPLLGLLIAETQPSIDDVMDRRVQCWVVTEQANRDRRAGQWRKARRDIADRDRKVQRALLTYWNQHRWLPGDPSYLLDMLHGFDRGRLVLVDGEIVPYRVVIPVSEAIAAFGNPKPVSSGWFNHRASKSAIPRTQTLSHPRTASRSSTQEGENRDHQQ